MTDYPVSDDAWGNAQPESETNNDGPPDPCRHTWGHQIDYEDNVIRCAQCRAVVDVLP